MLLPDPVKWLICKHDDKKPWHLCFYLIDSSFPHLLKINIDAN